MITLLPYVQIVLAVALTAAILLQQTEAGVGAMFGGGDSFGTQRTRRGFEKTLFNATIILSALFGLSIIASFVF